jgi:hypothetical protein
MGSTCRRYAGLSLILDDSKLTEAARRNHIRYFHSVGLRPRRMMTSAVHVTNAE